MKKQFLARISIILLCLIGGGCGGNEVAEQQATPQWAGEEVFARLACRACHSLTGQEGKKGPSLRGVGKNLSIPEMQEQLQTPRRRHPASRMPSFAFVRPGDFQALLDYLNSLK